MVNKLRIGHGVDVHALVSGDYLVIGGVRIAHHKAFLAHSDGDVLLHAICDACLGACGLGDIGQHFPDSDERYRGIASTELLTEVYRKVVKGGWCLVNLDATIMAEKPKLAPYLPEMSVNIAKVLEVDPTQINIKATTTERLGFEGRQEGISAHAVVLLCSRD